ncbi:bifunctional metallophosphatase/5'-nucleotidase [Acidipropionibacterium jensenii]|uniref:bifunctional metallophosphatase/5'-nucleotidase n=1 Tax=Acidipropionibacterium jensenii TaxID=1749 RepID=UPI0026483EAB|nr:5'-nucleotidase C-terminal domain-containing protein [Acidipropionibacterium jensenii]MDN6761816.1 5'-nucleotidase C-terminal domain-containing protein [Acidipropionibacterium jensenii]
MTATGGVSSAVLTILASTDVHGHLYNWDYFSDAPFPADPRSTGGQAQPPLGLARMSTIVARVRAERAPGAVALLDNGDTIQGTPLTYLWAHPERAGKDQQLDCDPMARAMDLMGYDAAVIGNHEFNAGLEVLAAHTRSLTAPLLGANVIDRSTGKPLTRATAMVEKAVAGHRVLLGVIGVTTPGSAVWDRSHLDGRVALTDPIEAAARQAGRLRRAGADVVVVLAHSGLDEADRPPIYRQMAENCATSLAGTVPEIDLVIAGHTHAAPLSRVVEGASGHRVLIAQPGAWASAIARVDIPLLLGDPAQPDRGPVVRVDHSAVPDWVTICPTAGQDDDPSLVADPQLAAAHRRTVAYVNTPVARCTTTLSARSATVRDTPILDLVAQTQVDAVARALADLGGEDADLPVIAQVSPFSRTAELPAGQVRLRDIAGMYPFENTLAAIRLTGGQLRDYLEHSASYFGQVAPGTPIDPRPVTEGGITRASRQGRTVWDYNFDALTGVTYRIDITRPVGSRICDLAWQGTELATDQPFALAVNNYRLNGGGGFPHVRQAPVLWDGQLEIRQLLIETVTERGVIDPADFFTRNWEVVAGR